MTTSPDFLNRVFMMRLPEPMGAQLSPQFSLQCNLFATPTMQGTAGRQKEGKGGRLGNDRRSGLLRSDVTPPLLL